MRRVSRQALKDESFFSPSSAMEGWRICHFVNQIPWKLFDLSAKISDTDTFQNNCEEHYMFSHGSASFRALLTLEIQ